MSSYEGIVRTFDITAEKFVTSMVFEPSSFLLYSIACNPAHTAMYSGHGDGSLFTSDTRASTHPISSFSVGTRFVFINV